MSVFTLVPYDGTRVTATLWCVGQLSPGGFVLVTEPMTKDAATLRERELRRAAKLLKVTP